LNREPLTSKSSPSQKRLKVAAVYIRTSKKDQNLEMQRRDLLALGCAKFFEE
jgi:hypothetical protein